MSNFVLIVVFVGLGLLFRRLKAFPKDSAQVLNMFALYVSLPALVLLKIPQLQIGREALLVAAVPWGLLILSAAFVLAAAAKFHWSRAQTGVLLLLVPLGNTSFMGVPMVNAFFGQQGIPYLIVYDQIGTMLIFALYGSLILALYGRDGKLRIGSIARRTLTFPPTLAVMAGLALRPWPYPDALQAALQGVSQSLTPLVMTAIGLQLNWRLPRHLLRPLGYGLLIKLLIAPLVTLGVCRLLGASGLHVDVAVFEAGMPPMVTAGAVAVIAGMESDLAIALIGIGIVVSFASLPLLFAILS
ncbi:MAG: AEC family transporter [Syntrophotalea acetylenica]|uniref:AEC family transporter n=1 Tax=Syntrophotalea TaxID=2812025 RepID=UPI002A3713FE|nr:AEC family transporter [Syntrophotalea acetylenica]MDD4456943.1 AEC family transporter [Syntrophotalea acetylenica]MDY0261035.1 AEC family transporter [Syntrophotalea acetylenica]